jgi:hypothetical protein
LSLIADSCLLPITPIVTCIITPAKMAISISRLPSPTRQTAWRAGAAVHAIQYYPEYKRFYQKCARRSSEATARTVVAKELAKIVYYIVKNKTQYKGLKGQPTRQNAQRAGQPAKISAVAAPLKPGCLTGNFYYLRLDWEESALCRGNIWNMAPWRHTSRLVAGSIRKLVWTALLR